MDFSYRLVVFGGSGSPVCDSCLLGLSWVTSQRFGVSHIVVLDVGPQLGQAAVLCAFLCFCGRSTSLFRGGEVGARMASRGHGRRVPLLAASRDGLVVIVVTTFAHDTSKYDSLHELAWQL
ncbi:hypothetical protein Taro_050275 [Colocasia esculenta]|uniref:Uncharacterized protein n=1 Tax=Colocasia esculenta TaxID=4460 RepID=A0A843XDB1_COLES|nr:hypothetical protein [Colocasia esculenta]